MTLAFVVYFCKIIRKIQSISKTKALFNTVKKNSCEITAFIAGNCVVCCFNSEVTKKIKKITYKTDKNANIFVILLVLFVILLIFFVNSLLKQQSTQLKL
jgi:hypothetical protein